MDTSKLAMFAVAAACIAGQAAAEYPDRPVSYIVPFPSGGLEDVLTRMITEDFAAKYGVVAAVVNKPSESGPFPGVAEVPAMTADGYAVGSFVVDIPVVGPDVGFGLGQCLRQVDAPDSYRIPDPDGQRFADLIICPLFLNEGFPTPGPGWLRPAGAYADLVVNNMRQRGILLSKLGRHKTTLKIRSPMPFAEVHLDLLISTLDAVLAETQVAA